MTAQTMRLCRSEASRTIEGEGCLLHVIGVHACRIVAKVVDRETGDNSAELEDVRKAMGVHVLLVDGEHPVPGIIARTRPFDAP